MLPTKRATLAMIVSAGLITLAGMAADAPGLAAASVSTQLQTARDQLANCQSLTAHSMGAQRTRAQQCVADQQAIINLLDPPTPSPTGTATVAPTQSSTPTAAPTTVRPTVTATVPPTSAPPTAGPTVCPAWPAVPDANCTGYAHTGVTLRQCPLILATAGTYDSCRFPGTVEIRVAGVKITRSLVDGGHVESNSGADLRGAVLEDVEIKGPGNDGSAAIGNNNYTCTRCNVHAGNRGFALGNHVVIQDSFAHDFWIQPSTQDSAHQTAISTHGGTDYKVLHSNLQCNSDKYACSAGFSFYAEDTDITNMLIQNCRITSDAGYGLLFGSHIAGKPFGIMNTTVKDNIIDSTEYGPVANWPGNQPGNVWSNNKRLNGTVIVP